MMPPQAVIGLIGGMSWESSAEYYRIINREVRNRLGGVHSARSLIGMAYRAIIARLVARGARSIILGCTEIMLLVSEADSPVPLFDTTALHALAAVDRALA
jgi:aspartate/glutamate racemase